MNSFMQREVLKIIFRKGFVRRRNLYTFLAVLPILGYSIFYEYPLYKNFWANNLQERVDLIPTGLKLEYTKDEHHQVEARVRRQYLK